MGIVVQPRDRDGTQPGGQAGADVGRQTAKLALTVRPVVTLGECQAIEGLQKAIWGFSDLDIIPAVQIYNTAKYGGQVLGGFDEGGRMVVFSYAMLARTHGGPVYLHSDLVGVLPGMQSAGIGFDVKIAQRRHALEAGISEIRWTYDPMETRNGNLNLRKLGGTGIELISNLYGAVDNALSGDLPTHRFMVSWKLDRPVGAAIEFPSSAPQALATHGVPAVNAGILASGDAMIVLSTPLNFQELKAADLDTARRWQAAFCESSQYLFLRGYSAVNFRRNDASGMGEYLFAK